MRTYNVRWSDADQSYLANDPEYPSIMTHGDTQIEALEELLQILEWAFQQRYHLEVPNEKS